MLVKPQNNPNNIGALRPIIQKAKDESTNIKLQSKIAPFT